MQEGCPILGFLWLGWLLMSLLVSKKDSSARACSKPLSYKSWQELLLDQCNEPESSPSFPLLKSPVHDIVTNSIWGCSATEGKTGEEMIREMFRNASLFNLNTVRVYAHTTDPDHRVQVSFKLALLDPKNSLPCPNAACSPYCISLELWLLFRFCYGVDIFWWLMCFCCDRLHQERWITMSCMALILCWMKPGCTASKSLSRLWITGNTLAALMNTWTGVGRHRSASRNDQLIKVATSMIRCDILLWL
jgi:hypothetical protein